jgi:dCMP deaminase
MFTMKPYDDRTWDEQLVDRHHRNKAWDKYFLDIANVVKTKSKDVHTQIGVVVVGKNNEIVSTGYNSFPRGINDNVPERQERPEKYFWFEHAERNAIYNAARIGVSTLGCTMYMTCAMPCADCARAIINAGITRIVLGNGDSAKGGHTDSSYSRSLQMFTEAEIEVVHHENTDL